MCGIYGYAGKVKDAKKVTKLMELLAVESEERGRDSAGFVAMNERGYWFDKEPVRARQFVEEHDLFDVINKGARFFIGHNRWASCGKVNKVNAHPFQGDRYFLVHNGTNIQARHEVERLGLSCEGETDSEAMLRVIEHYGLEEACEVLGKWRDYSIVLLDYTKNNDVAYFMRDDNKPMVVFELRKKLGVRVFCSDKKIVRRALEGLNKVSHTFSQNEINDIIEKSWSTKPYHRYSCDITGEFENLGRYAEERTTYVERTFNQKWDAKQGTFINVEPYTAKIKPYKAIYRYNSQERKVEPLTSNAQEAFKRSGGTGLNLLDFSNEEAVLNYNKMLANRDYWRFSKGRRRNN